MASSASPLLCQSGVWCKGNEEIGPTLPLGSAFLGPPTGNKHQSGTNYWSLEALWSYIKARASLGVQETARFHLHLVSHSYPLWSDFSQRNYPHLKGDSLQSWQGLPLSSGTWSVSVGTRWTGHDFCPQRSLLSSLYDWRVLYKNTIYHNYLKNKIQFSGKNKSS